MFMIKRCTRTIIHFLKSEGYTEISINGLKIRELIIENALTTRLLISLQTQSMKREF
jgi:hypothetical protein